MLREEAIREIIGHQQGQTADAPFALHLTRQGVEPVEFEDRRLQVRFSEVPSSKFWRQWLLIGDLLWLKVCSGFAIAREA